MQCSFVALEILYRDEWLVAVDKPAGLLVHKTAQATDRWTCMNILRDQLGCWVYPLHRLDRKTSGVLLFALSSEAAKKAGELFAERELKKEYLAVVRGWTESAGCIDHALTDADTGAVRAAVTEYNRLSTYELPIPCGRYETARFSLVQALPQTGRPHQIRRHMHHINHPIIGDTTHGDGTQNRFFREHFACDRMLLHARSLTFTHPFTAASITISSAVEKEFADVIARF